MKKEIAKGRFLTGAMYAPFCRTLAVDESEWDKDLKNMADNGYTVVHGFAEWHDIEYKKGEFDFSKIDHMIECAHKHGLTVIVNVATQNSVGFYSPRWLMEEYRDIGNGFTDANGNFVKHGQFVVPCIDDPYYQKYAKRYLAEVAKHLGKDKRVSGYVLWGEPILCLPNLGSASICYCKHTIAKFRKYLKDKYKTIDALNSAWSTEGPSDFSDFDSVQPPSGPARQLGGFVSFEDFKEFMEGNLAGHIKEADKIFKENGAMQPTICEMLTGIHNSIDSWKLAETTDIIGTSCFDRPGRMASLYLSMADSMARALDKTTFVVEAGSGPVKYVLPVRSPDYDELSSTLLQRANHGIKGLMYWCWRPRISDVEGNDFGLVRSDGKVLKKTAKLGKLAKDLDRVYPSYENSQRDSKVAILSSQYINHLMDYENMTDNYIDALKGANFMMQDLHINSDFISEKRIKLGDLEKYKVLILPCSYVLSEEASAKICEFVKKGGVVIADYLLAEKRPGGVCYTSLPGGGLDKVFGVEREDIYPIDHQERLLKNDYGVTLNSTVEELFVTTAKVVDKYNEDLPVLTKNHYFDGKAYYIASQFFKGYLTDPSSSQREIVKNLLKEVGIESKLELVLGDKENQSQLLTAVTFDKVDESVAVATITNAGYGEKSDAIILDNANYEIIGNYKTLDTRIIGEKLKVDFTLSSWQSFAIVKK